MSYFVCFFTQNHIQLLFFFFFQQVVSLMKYYIAWNKWKCLGTNPGDYEGCERTSHLNDNRFSRVGLAACVLYTVFMEINNIFFLFIKAEHFSRNAEFTRKRQLATNVCSDAPSLFHQPISLTFSRRQNIYSCGWCSCFNSATLLSFCDKHFNAKLLFHHMRRKTL